MVKIGILGGTFNPPHLGHLYMAEQILAEFALDKAVFLPSGQPPHKPGRIIADKKNRYEMCRLLCHGKEKIEVWEMELLREKMTYTVDTMTELSEKYAQNELYYMIGSDTLFVLESWRDFPEVAKRTYFICLPRPDEDAIKREEIRNKAHAIEEKYQTKVFISKYAGPDISSSMIREKLHKGEDIMGLVPENLRQYMQENHLYEE